VYDYHRPIPTRGGTEADPSVEFVQLEGLEDTTAATAEATESSEASREDSSDRRFLDTTHSQPLTSVTASSLEAGRARGLVYDCVICMEEVECGLSSDYMVTPCSHVFHPPCLQRWMEVKMECPTCRAELPIPGGRPFNMTNVAA